MQPSREREGKPEELAADWSRLRRDGGCWRVGEVVFEPLGRSPSGCSRAALFAHEGFRFVSQNCGFGFGWGLRQSGLRERARLGCSPRASARGNPRSLRRTGRACGAMGGCWRVGAVVFEPLGRSPSGCSRAALFAHEGFRFVAQNCGFGFLGGEWFPGGGTGGMQPSREREGKPEELAADWSRLRRDGGCWRVGEVVFEPLGRSPSGCSRAALFGRGGFRFVSQNCGFGFLGGEWFPGGGTGGMQPSREREGKPEELAADWSRLRRDGGCWRVGAVVF
ncbi:MAG: hypothetical protein KatS3mg005_0236 [Bryobacteraceae bacterium]|nr:MAG: hypothetical protein KatS3mg005_0236 [Bryobacteraceae bacterium]